VSPDAVYEHTDVKAFTTPRSARGIASILPRAAAAASAQPPAAEAVTAGKGGGKGGSKGSGGKGRGGDKRSPYTLSASHGSDGGDGSDGDGGSGVGDDASAWEAALNVLRGEGEEFHLTSSSLVTPGFLAILRRDGRVDAPTPPPPLRTGDLFPLQAGVPPPPLKPRPSLPPAQFLSSLPPPPGAARGEKHNHHRHHQHHQEQQQRPVAYARLRAGATAAPGPLAEWELLGLMEAHGIGTDASMATHVENVTKRKYATLGPGRTLVPTPLGTVLVQG
jgi:hypothetical protein